MADLDPNVDWAFVDSIVNEVRTMYPALAWMLDVPALADILIKAGLERWDGGRVVAAIQGTDWWKERNDGARGWEELLNRDPASAEQQRQALTVEVKQFAARSGITLTDDEATFIAADSLRLGRSQAEWQTSIVARFVTERGQSAKVVATNLRSLAAEYAVPMSDVALRQWEANTLNGMADEATFRAYLQEQAKSLFPGLANAIDRGITVRQYVAPYQEIAVQELGINAAEIDWRDPKWSQAIHKIDGQGNPVSMSLSDWTKEIRSNSVYGFDQTQRAQEQATMLGQALKQRLGRAA